MKILNIVTIASLLAGFSIATTAFAVAGKNEKAADETIAYNAETNEPIPHVSVDYDVNENGETYGIETNSPYMSDQPDLIPAIGDNGKQGYVRNSELIGEAPSSPEEAIRIQEERRANGNPPMVVNVYESDGVTVIDTLTSSN